MDVQILESSHRRLAPVPLIAIRENARLLRAPVAAGARCRHLHYNVPVPESPQLAKVLDHLRLYEHPLLAFSARESNGLIEILIDLKNSTIPVHQYVLPIHARDLDHPQFTWHLQRQLYDGLHDYFIEMFTSTPQDRKNVGLV